MTKGNGTTAGVQLFPGDTKSVDGVEGLRSEGLVNFEDVNILDGKASLLKSGRDSNSGADSHDLRRATSHGKTENSALNLESEFLGNISSGKKNCCSSISDLAGVSSGDATTLLESTLELGETFNGGVFTDTIILINNNLRLISILVFNDSFIGSDLLGEPAILLSGSSLLVAFSSQLILFLAGYLVLFSDILRGHAHVHQAVAGALIVEHLICQDVRVNHGVHGEEGHGLDTTADADVDLAGSDRVGDGHDCLQARGALSVNCLQGGGIGEAREEAGDPRGVRTCTGLEHVSDADVFNELGVDARVLDDGLKDGGKHGLGGGVLLAALLCLGHGSTSEGDDHDIIIALGGNRVSVEGLVVGQMVLEKL